MYWVLLTCSIITNWHNLSILSYSWKLFNCNYYIKKYNVKKYISIVKFEIFDWNNLSKFNFLETWYNNILCVISILSILKYYNFCLELFIYSFLKQVERAMQYIWLVEIVGSTVLLCLTGYYVIMVIINICN